MPGVAVILPARYHSTRFPGKPLAELAGKPLIEWVYRRAEQVRGVARIVVATDHNEIKTVVESFGGNVVLTSSSHATGTDRVAEVARSLDEDCIVNLQGDEPVFPPGLIEEMIAGLESSSDVDIVTACHKIDEASEIDDPNVVKVVMDRSNRVLYFSRSPIPFSSTTHSRHAHANESAYRHVGIYVYRKSSLLRFAELPPSPLEQSEGLEQLRALENGMTIHVVETRYSTVGVDVPEDIKNVEKAITTP